MASNANVAFVDNLVQRQRSEHFKMELDEPLLESIVSEALGMIHNAKSKTVHEM